MSDSTGLCEVCSHPTRERGNGHANLCHLHDPVAQLGARVVEILRAGKEVHVTGDWLAEALRECAAAGVPAKLNAAEAEGVAERIGAFDAINGAARSLGLLGEEVRRG